MNIVNKFFRKELALILFLSMTLFSFFFYLMWSVPITILAKAFNISNYFITGNFFVLLLYLIPIVCLFLLMILFLSVGNLIYSSPYIKGYRKKSKYIETQVKNGEVDIVVDDITNSIANGTVRSIFSVIILIFYINI